MKYIKSSIIPIFLILLVSCVSNIIDEHKASDMELIKQDIAKGSMDSAALKRLLADAKLAMNIEVFSVLDNTPVPPSGDRHDYYSWSSYMWPNPETSDGLPYIHKDGKINPATDTISDKPLLRRMVMAVHTLTLASFYTGNQEYANKALSFLKTWFLDTKTKMNPNLTFAQCIPGDKLGKPYGVIDTRWLIILVDAIDILEEMDAIEPSDLMQLKEWFTQYLDWLETSETGKQLLTFENNIGSWYMAQKASYAVFTEQDSLAEQFIESGKKFFTTQIDSIGRVTHELHRTKSFDYSLYSINALLSLLEVERKLAIPASESAEIEKETLLKSIKYMAGFYNTDKEWPYPQIAEKVISLNYEDGIAFSVYYPYDLYYTLCKSYSIFKDSALMDAMTRIPNEKTKSHRANLLFYLSDYQP